MVGGHEGYEDEVTPRVTTAALGCSNMEVTCDRNHPLSCLRHCNSRSVRATKPIPYQKNIVVLGYENVQKKHMPPYEKCDVL